MQNSVFTKPGAAPRMLQPELTLGWVGESMPSRADQLWKPEKLHEQMKKQLPAGVFLEWHISRSGAALFRVVVPCSVKVGILESLRDELANSSGWKIAFDTIAVGEGIEKDKVAKVLRAHPWPDDLKAFELRGAELLVYTSNLSRFYGRKDRSENKIKAIFPGYTIVPMSWDETKVADNLNQVRRVLCHKQNAERIKEQAELLIPKEICANGAHVELNAVSIRIDYGSSKVSPDIIEASRRAIELKTGFRTYFHRRINYSAAIDYIREQLPPEFTSARVQKLSSQMSLLTGMPKPCILVGCQVNHDDRLKFFQFIERVSNELPIPVHGRISVTDASITQLVHESIPLKWNLRRLSMYEGNRIAVLRCASKVGPEGVPIVESMAERLNIPVLLKGVTHQQVIPEVAAKVGELIPKEVGVTGICKHNFRDIHLLFISNPLIPFNREAVRTLLGGELYVLPAKADSVTMKTMNVASIQPRKQQTNQQTSRAVAKTIAPTFNYGTLRGFGGCEEIGRSSFLLNVSGKNILLDCGVGFGEDPYPTIPSSVARILDAVVLTHAHTDHSGYLPWLYTQGCKAPIYMTSPTFEIAQMLVRDFVNVSERYKEVEVPFKFKDIVETFARAQLLKFDERIQLGPDTHLTFLNAGHIPGSAMALIEDKNRILYTGDIRCENTKLLLGAKLPREIDHLIMDATYGDRAQDPRKLSEQRFLEVVDETLRAGGTVLIPSFAVGRAQEILALLNQHPEIGPERRFPLYVTGMINSVNKVVLDYMSRIENENVYLNPALAMLQGKELAGIRGALSGPRASTVATVSDGRPKVILSTSGMCEGPAAEYLRFVSQDSKNLVVLVGYQSEKTIGRALQSGVKQLSLGKTPYTIRSRVETIGFSGHADSEQLIQQLSASQPKNVIAVHSTLETIRGFKSEVGKRIPAIQVQAAKLGQEIKFN